MQQVVSKSQFKAQALQFLRTVQEKKQPLVVTHAGRPVVKVIPYKKEDTWQMLRNTVVFYKDPYQSVGEWEALK